MIGLLQFFLLKQMDLETIPGYFWVLSISTILVALGGYVINDFFDREIDKINRPGKNLFELHFMKSKGLILYILVVLASLALPWFWGEQSLLMVVLFVNATMLFYAYLAKKWILVGNFIVAASMAAVPLVFFVIDSPSVSWEKALSDNSALILLYTLFVFLFSMPREMVKDMEDIEGDKASGLKTAAIILPGTFNRYLISMFLVLAVSLIVSTIWFIWAEELLFSSVSIYYFIFLLLPISVKSVYMAVTAKEKEDWTKLSQWLKMIMLAGIISIAIV